MEYRFEDALPVLQRTPGTLRALLLELPDAWVRATEGPGTWSPFDVVGHLIHGERTDWVPRVEHILRHGDAVPFPPFDREAMITESAGRTLRELLDTFDRLRAESLDRLAALGLTDADLSRRGQHPGLGAVTLGQHLATWVAHDLSHVGQVVRVMARQYSDAVGPWRAYLSILDTAAGKDYLADATRRFREAQSQCDRALAQVPFERWSHRLDPGSNSIVTLMLHMSGNMLSRWTDFLSTDGEKPDRDRDAEFEDPAGLTREALLARWSAGWECLFRALSGLTAADLGRTVTIRSQPHTVVEAVNRQIAHYALHTGQLVFLCKHLAGPAWETLSVPRHGSAAFNAAMMRRPEQA